MAQYTVTLQQILKQGINIFDFDYDCPFPDWKANLEEDIKNFYMMDEIGFETIDRFLFELEVKMKSIMPYYVKLYRSDLIEQRITDNYDVTETYTRELKGNGTNRGTNNSSNLSKFSDTPMSSDALGNSFLTNVTDDLANTEYNAESTTDNLELFTRTMKGNIGVQTDADAIIKYRKTLIKINLMIIDELRELFMLIF